MARVVLARCLALIIVIVRFRNPDADDELGQVFSSTALTTANQSSCESILHPPWSTMPNPSAPHGRTMSARVGEWELPDQKLNLLKAEFLHLWRESAYVDLNMFWVSPGLNRMNGHLCHERLTAFSCRSRIGENVFHVEF